MQALVNQPGFAGDLQIGVNDAAFLRPREPYDALRIEIQTDPQLVRPSAIIPALPAGLAFRTANGKT
jgi:hypothetical protein